MKKPGRIKTLTIASLSALAIAAPIALAQNTSTDQNNKPAISGERGGEGKRFGSREGKRGWSRGGRHGRHGGGLMLAGVNLTDDQKAKMKAIGTSFRESNKSLREQLRAKRQELRQSNQGGTFNEALANQKLQETAGLQAKLMAARFNMRQQMLAVLTPEQKTQLEQKRAEFKAKRAQHAEHKMN